MFNTLKLIDCVRPWLYFSWCGKGHHPLKKKGDLYIIETADRQWVVGDPNKCAPGKATQLLGELKRFFIDCTGFRWI